MKRYKTVLTIAGSDSSGGAGIQADIKTISSCGCYAASVITAVTAQNTSHVFEILDLPPTIVAHQLNAVFNDIEIDAIKIGMLFNHENLDAVFQVLSNRKSCHIILDPIMVSKSGVNLMHPDMINDMKEYLFPITTLITPNLHEAEKLLGHKIHHLQDANHSIKELANQYKTNILIKGGHFDNDLTCHDSLYLYQDNQFYEYKSQRIQTKNTHGTGCTYSSAIASFLARGLPLHDAVAAAKSYISTAIKSGSQYQIGNGFGPVDHFFNLQD